MLKDAKAHQIFQSFARITVGDGESVLFWTDRWINGLTAQEIAPEVWKLVPPRKRNTRTVAEALLGNAWTEDLRGERSPACILQCVLLHGEIIEVPRDAARPDLFAWKGSSSGQYSAKDTYNYLRQGRECFAAAEWIWSPWAPAKCKIFAWLAIQHRLWTANRRTRHGLQDHTSPCFVCLQEEDTVEHLLMQCSFAREVWFRCLRRLEIQVQEPQRGSTLEVWWGTTRARFRSKERKSFDSFVILTCWKLWKHRNAHVFNNVRLQHTAALLAQHISEEFVVWRSASVGEGERVTGARE
jgi:hypothetical protein